MQRGGGSTDSTGRIMGCRLCVFGKFPVPQYRCNFGWAEITNQQRSSANIKTRRIREAVLFLKKKNQKDFINSGAGMFVRQWPRLKKVFWFFFSKKNRLLS